MDTKHYDLIVFGGGNAISIAVHCGAKGMHVALVEQGPLGGTCPHRGCIPSKLLIGYADAAECARAARRWLRDDRANARSRCDSARYLRVYEQIRRLAVSHRDAHADGSHSNRDSEALLFCIGRVPNSDNIGIQNTDLKPNPRGYVETDDHLRTPVEGVYTMGDI